MIELIVADRCTNCGACVDVCPTNVIEPARSGPPILARVEDCQTCFMCELYCVADAIYVAPDCDRRVSVDPDEIVAAGRLGQYRRHSGWDEWDGLFPNEQWLMETVFRRAGEAAASDKPQR
ncbi:ferredoxin family protein [Bradyrhizobium sp. U87765 SZCCT0131]|uniref:4Fe-4S dicluster domain-containing protein n=1 Tax=unclassified Bradyrhizobium TaxID=2631580 RepID=UPI001BA69524|nr:MULTISPECIES: ferredoxin family protein [unclassified Bradyrhizobium]MBR1223001.1 ferredoxin family protein [Bradyrhizobium sp. U87765 SZCCT0131]MBR1262737.1 ferredoxin family protein [Bradyrhizobium sp. U87765 SZCCT0134]MBR1308791.1 ferredoxin family protein [Bradyrhizobium sp. U87765 SZCCT0110]MBR1318519.1 ferredoxin family protein [Bradyrhizobium sp. U87765 SZCCT0109]MBR1352223.1 ferredoxin family protein [Bradyrhizobium sp. U87765 SZCCT0048]